jgi:hypothetical protein
MNHNSVREIDTLEWTDEICKPPIRSRHSVYRGYLLHSFEFGSGSRAIKIYGEEGYIGCWDAEEYCKGAIDRLVGAQEI